MHSGQTWRFVLLAYGVTWLLVTPLVLGGLGMIPTVPAWVHGVGALGPLAAAYFSPRDRGLFAASGPSRLGSGWVLLSLTTPVLFALLALAAAAATGEPVVGPLTAVARDPDWLLSLAAGSLAYGFGEEAGWRGWLQPRLQARHSAIVATLILTPMWAVWHAPFFFYRFAFDGPVTVVGFFVGLLAGAFWLAFLYNSTSSVLVVAVWHVLWNVANIWLLVLPAVAIAVLNGLMMILGFGVAAVYGRRGLRVPDVDTPATGVRA